MMSFMAESRLPDSLSALAWLVDAGADEAVLDAPVDRFASIRPPLEGGPKSNSSASEKMISGRGHFSTGGTGPSPKFASQISTLPQGEGKGSSATNDSDHIGRAMEIAAACRSLAELKAALEAFDGCALKKSATSTVFADGVPDKHILFIGEAPGAEEDRRGLPFVGRAGQLLDKMLGSIGLSRSENAYITNVLNWRPPGNRDPDPTEVAMCIPFLRRHIELVDPGIIVLLGKVAVRNVVGITDGIMATRGRWLEYFVNGRMVPVMPTLHPAYLLRQPAHKKLAWRDLQAIDQKINALGLLAAHD
jgi:DNA polymerase